MSQAYDKFLKQYDAQGRDKYEGEYGTNIFKLMSDQERAIAEDMLIAIADKDVTAIEGLQQIGTPRAIHALESLLSKFPNKGELNLYCNVALWCATKKDVYQQGIASNIDTTDLYISQKSYDYLAYTKPNICLLNESLKIIRSEKSEDIRSLAASAILWCFGLVPDMYNMEDDIIEYSIGLIDPSSEKRELTLSEVRKKALRIPQEN